jgi:hypothetical protein
MNPHETPPAQLWKTSSAVVEAVAKVLAQPLKWSYFERGALLGVMVLVVGIYSLLILENISSVTSFFLANAKMKKFRTLS